MPPDGARIHAVVNQKGGVAKTTTAVNLATALAATGRRALVVDLDPQGNASTGLGIAPDRRRFGAWDLMLAGARLDDAAMATGLAGFDVVPSTAQLFGAEIALADTPRRETRLRDALGGATGRYDYVLIDCPPSLGLLTVNALTAARRVLVPLQTEFLALEGLVLLRQTVEAVRAALNPGLSWAGILLTMSDRRNRLSAEVEADVRGHGEFGRLVYDTVIPRNVRVSEAPSHGKPVIVYDMRASGSQAYIRFAGEFLRREEGAP